MAEQNGAQSRPPTGQYPSPQSYPSPQMQSTYAYPPPQGQAGEPYRHSPTASNAALPPVNLPPLRSIDGQPQPPQLLPQQNNSQMSQPMPPMPSYYQHPPQGMAHPGQGMPYARYAPIPQGGQMTGGRHKKEIKRRTKTGCLTCRKRRIKCDEQHPVCRNCQKSKRDCLGYDPIFKQSSGPHTIQAAPSASPSSASPTPASTTSAPAPFSPRQPDYPPPPHSATYPPTPKTATAPHPSHQDPQPYEYTSAIDPALAESPKTERRPPESNNSQLSPGVKMEGAKGKPARQINVEDLFQVDRYGPYDIPASQTPLSEKDKQNICGLYLHDFAPGLDKILETEWFNMYGVDRILASPSLSQELAELMKHFAVIDRHHGPEGEGRCRASEARTVWRLLNLCRPQPDGANGAAPQELDLQDVHARLEVLECLITNRLLDERRVKPVQWQEGWSKDKLEDLLFWASLAKFSTRSNDDPTATHDMEKYLGQCRNLLNGKENRDVIYSIMIVRHFGWRVPNFPDQIQPEKGGENSIVNKVFIARQFIGDQAQFKGTNHPIQRLCDMVVRSWAIGW